MLKFLESPFSIEQYSQESDEAEMERGAFYSQEEVEKITGDNSLEKRNQNPPVKGINWVIVGGESGHNARPTNPD
ncbi:hypothetical protein [Cyclobacterium sp.]|uniref:hypothetical protein n=1 Tax=Cyclobacterium sp. TaxID=1966343 RepID=UPI001998BF46|nr:hypothetical protein [Cyclobacterium sp.]MBD3629353.1 hypothetical protein [Cyclobacterium sp.]